MMGDTLMTPSKAYRQHQHYPISYTKYKGRCAQHDRIAGESIWGPGWLGGSDGPWDAGYGSGWTVGCWVSAVAVTTYILAAASMAYLLCCCLAMDIERIPRDASSSVGTYHAEDVEGWGSGVQDGWGVGSRGSNLGHFSHYIP